MPSTTVLRLAALALGPGTLCMGVLVLWLTARRRSRWVPTSGTVVDQRIGAADNLSAVIRFTTADGRVVEGPQRPTVDIGIYPHGDVAVWYDPARPERFSSQRAWFDRPGLVLVAFGSVVSVMAAVVLSR